MNILLLNSILRTADNNRIPAATSIKDCMIYNLALGFKELGHRVTLVAATEYAPVAQEDYEVEVVFLPSTMKKIFLLSVLPFQPQLWGFLRRHKASFDLIISSEVVAFPSLFAAIQAPEKTLIWQELAFHQRKFYQLPSRLWHNIIARLFFGKTRIVARSEEAKRFISNYLHNVAPQTVEHGINANKFFYSAEKKRQFIVVSQLIERKNIGSIISKFARFVRHNNDFKLIIAGTGELETALKQQTANLGIEQHVEFVGFKPHAELNSLLATSMAMLIDTKRDLNMVTVPESIVCGTPLVMNLVPCTATTVNRYQLGIAKSDWNETDLQMMVNNNAFYVKNCIDYRAKLTTVYAAEQLLLMA